MEITLLWFSWQDLGLSHLLVSFAAALCLYWVSAERRRKASSDDPLFAVILGISTGNPRYRVSREQAFRHAESVLDPASPVARVLARIYNNSRIDARYFCVPDLTVESSSTTDGTSSERKDDVMQGYDDFIEASMGTGSRVGGVGGAAGTGGEERVEMFYPSDGSFRVSTSRRFERYAECALPLATEVAKKAMREVGARPSDIGRIVLVTSTGVCGPGLDGELVRSIGLNHSVEREVVSFQGCGAGINGLRLASQTSSSLDVPAGGTEFLIHLLSAYAVTHPGRLALLITVELPSLHMHKGDDSSVNEAILHAIFGDGCAVAVVGGRTGRTANPGSLAVLDNRSWLVDGTEDGIEMTFGDNGVSCKLSKRLPDYVKTNVSDFVDEMLGAHGVDKTEVDFWALHPGGHRIVEETRRSLHLSLEETEGCSEVLRDFGNMVSATVLFVLERALAEHRRLLRETGGAGFRHVVALSFSPGVTVEGVLLKAFPTAPSTRAYGQG